MATVETERPIPWTCCFGLGDDSTDENEEYEEEAQNVGNQPKYRYRTYPGHFDYYPAQVSIAPSKA